MANYISITRIFLVLTLFLTQPLSTEFFIIYFVCGLSDILDGYIARKTATTSKLGEKLDSVADLIMVTVLIIILYPVLNLTNIIFIWIVIIVVIRMVSMIIVYVKYKTFGILHTYGNKITGLMLLLYPVILAIDRFHVLTYVICLTASLSAVEELIIHLSSRELNVNMKSIFFRF